MMDKNMETWDALRQPPATALKTIRGGRLQGMTDINPQWRYKAMTEQFGVCGVGWKYQIMKTWSEQGADGVILAFAQVALFIKVSSSDWSDSIHGIGGSTMVAKEKSGLYSSDECYKMAVTDALSVAMKMLGVASDIYEGLWDGSKYRDAPQKSTGGGGGKEHKPASASNEISDKQKKFINGKMVNNGMDSEQRKAFFAWKNPKNSKEASDFIENFDTILETYMIKQDGK
jgi:hypothetical protein